MDIRALHGILFYVKSIIINKGENRSLIWVDTETNKVLFNGEEIVRVKIVNDQLSLEYEPEWKEYLCTEETKLQEKIDAYNSKLEKRKNWKGSGKGKAPKTVEAEGAERKATVTIGSSDEQMKMIPIWTRARSEQR